MIAEVREPVEGFGKGEYRSMLPYATNVFLVPLLVGRLSKPAEECRDRIPTYKKADSFVAMTGYDRFDL